MWGFDLQGSPPLNPALFTAQLVDAPGISLSLSNLWLSKACRRKSCLQIWRVRGLGWGRYRGLGVLSRDCLEAAPTFN